MRCKAGSARAKSATEKNWRTNEFFTYSAKCCSVMTCWRQTSADWAQIKKKHNKTPSKVTQIPHLLWPAINLPALEAIFSSPSTLCVIEKLREGTTGSLSDPPGGHCAVRLPAVRPQGPAARDSGSGAVQQSHVGLIRQPPLLQLGRWRWRPSRVQPAHEGISADYALLVTDILPRPPGGKEN